MPSTVPAPVRLMAATPSRDRVPRTRMMAVLLTASTGGFLCLAFTVPDHGRSAAVMLAIFFASVVASVAGFAFSAIAGALLFHLQDDPVRIVQILIICSIANQAAMTWALRRDIDWGGLRPYVAGGAAGLAIGVWLLLHADRTLYTHAMGGLLLAYGSYMLLRRAVVIGHHPVIVDVAAGFLGGITGGAAGFPSLCVTIWCSMKGWNKARQRAVIQPFTLIMQVAGLAAIGLAQRSHAQVAGLDVPGLIFIPASLLGTAAGLALYARMTDRQFGRTVNLLLIVSGLSYVM